MQPYWIIGLYFHGSRCSFPSLLVPRVVQFEKIDIGNGEVSICVYA